MYLTIELCTDPRFSDEPPTSGSPRPSTFFNPQKTHKQATPASKPSITE